MTGKIMDRFMTGELADDYPSVVVAISCENGVPEGSLAHHLLRNGAVAALAASSASSYTVGESRFEHSYSSSGWAYQFVKLLVQNNPISLGAATYESKSFLGFEPETGRLSKNLVVFNLYGDPGLSWRVSAPSLLAAK